MTTSKKTLMSLLLSISLIGCTGDYYFVDSCNENDMVVSPGLTKVVKGNDSISNYFVSEDDILSYLQFKKLAEKKDEIKVSEIAPLTNENGNICAYAINYSEGWEIISADKRYPPVIGQSAVGCFKYEETIEPIAVWLNSCFEDIELLRQSENLSEVFTESSFEIMDSYQEFWKIITADQDYIESNRHMTRQNIGSGGGSWQLLQVVTDTIGYEKVEHLITTHWHQDAPYNSYCPLTSYSSIYRAPAGCVAIAGAQTEYFLHNKIGLPERAPLYAFCSAQVPSSTGWYIAYYDDPQMYAYNFSSTAWDEMETDDDVIAALIAHVGICTSMEYSNSVSLSSIGDLVIPCFNNNGIDCSYSDLDNNTYSALYSNILSGLPVIARAECTTNGVSAGHAFIIDGYKNSRVRTSTIYTWVPDNPQTTPQFYDDRIVIRYSLPINHQITMNWGWGDDYPYDAGWYYPAGEWHLSSYNFDHSKKIIYNFSSAM